MSLNGVTVYWYNNMPNTYYRLTNEKTNENVDFLFGSCWKTRYHRPLNITGNC